MEKLIGGEAIADFLGISPSYFFRLKKKYRGTRYQAPTIRQWVGPPGRRHRIIWTMKEDILNWFYQVKELGKNSTTAQDR